MTNLSREEYAMQVVRAWSDENFRNSLSEEQKANLPEPPAWFTEELQSQGELSDEDLDMVAGGALGWAGSNYILEGPGISPS